MKKLICLIFGHKYRLKRIINSSIRELYCKRCNEEFAMHDDVQTVLPLDPELKALNQDSFNMKKFSIIYIIAHILILITYVILGVYTSAYSIDGFIIPSSFIVFIIITLISLIFYGGIYGEDDIAFKEADELIKEKEKYRKERIRLKKIIDKGLKI